MMLSYILGILIFFNSKLLSIIFLNLPIDVPVFKNLNPTEVSTCWMY